MDVVFVWNFFFASNWMSFFRFCVQDHAFRSILVYRRVNFVRFSNFT